jgi:hypothetical protein
MKNPSQSSQVNTRSSKQSIKELADVAALVKQPGRIFLLRKTTKTFSSGTNKRHTADLSLGQSLHLLACEYSL